MLDLRDLATLDRTIHEPARLMIMTVLYAVTEADSLYLQQECGLTQGESVQPPVEVGKRQVRADREDVQGEVSADDLQSDAQGRGAFEEYLRKIGSVSDATGNGEHKPKNDKLEIIVT